MNKVILIGNIGQKPETKNFENGSVTNFTLATNRKYKTADGWQSETEWHNIEAFGKLGSEVLQKYADKGSKVSIVGRIKTVKFSKDNTERYFTKIICEDLELLDKKTDSN